MRKQKTRDEISNEYKWDLTSIYKDVDSFNKDCEELSKKIDNISKYKDILFDNIDNFKNFLLLDESIGHLFNKLGAYAHLSQSEDKSVVLYQNLTQKIDNLSVKYDLNTAFVNPLFFKTDFKKIEEYMAKDAYINSYKFTLLDKLRYKEHSLDEKSEKLLSLYSKALSASSNTYSFLTDTDIKYGTIKDEIGNDVELTNSNYSIFIKSKDRNVRKNAFKTMYDTYASFKNTITQTYLGEVNTNIATARSHNYKTFLESCFMYDNIEKEVYTNLKTTIASNLDVLYKYYDLKKKILGLDELHLYDVYVDLIPSSSKNYSYEEAKEIVSKALSVLTSEYTNVLEKAFNERWIDVYNNTNKTSGAFSSGNYDTNPYVLLNYESKLQDVSTLAHELGHSLHTYFSVNNNTYQEADYHIFIAEVASTVNELLLNYYLLENSTSKEEKLTVLNNLLELYKGTLYRQTMFATFEEKMYSDIEKDKVHNYESISNYYYDLVKKYFGNNVFCDEEIKYEWEIIPHFYYGFYVYKYATSISASTYIVKNILSGNQDYIKKYLDFLKVGGSKYPLDALKVADVDLTKKEVIEATCEEFNKLVNEFEKLYKEVYKKGSE